MNQKNKLIELFIYVVIVVIGIILLFTNPLKEKTEGMKGESEYAVVLDEQ